jgi:hypothetical protein
MQREGSPETKKYFHNENCRDRRELRPYLQVSKGALIPADRGMRCPQSGLGVLMESALNGIPDEIGSGL